MTIPARLRVSAIVFATVALFLSAFPTLAGAQDVTITSHQEGDALHSGSTITWSPENVELRRWQITIGASLNRPLGLYTSKMYTGNDPYETTVGQLPADGEPLFVRVSYLPLSGSWVRKVFEFNGTDPSLLANVTSPVAGSELIAGQEFTWSKGLSLVEQWSLVVGSRPGASNYFNSGIRNTSGPDPEDPLVASLNQDGKLVYARFSYRIKGAAWIRNDYTYTAPAPVEPEVTVSPAPGSVLKGYDTISWSTNETSIKRWIITIGASEARPTGLYTSGSKAGTVPPVAQLKQLPADGEPLYLRLRYQASTGEWRQFDYQYQGVDPTSLARITAPAAGSVLSATSEFQWQAGLSNIDEWTLAVGTRRAGRDLFYSGVQDYEGDGSVEVDIPADGDAIYVRFAYRYNRSSWTYVDSTYLAPAPPDPAVITSPAAGSTIRPKTTFTWAPGDNNYDQWQLTVGANSRTAQGLFTSALFDSEAPLSVTATHLPYNGKPLYVKVRYRLRGKAWTNIIQEYQAADSIVAPQIESPTPGDVIETDTTFTMADDDAAMYRWRFKVGSSLNRNDVYSSPLFTVDDSLVLPVSIPPELTEVFVELSYREKTSGWKQIRAEYPVGAQPVAPTFVTPQANSELENLDSVSWSEGDAVFDEWRLSIGTSAEDPAAYFESDVFAADDSRDVIVSGLPTDGSLLYARVLYRLDGQDWNEISETFVAAFTDPLAPVINTHHEAIPNPVYDSALRVAAGCLSVVCYWDDADTWSTGVVPDDSSLVIINGQVRIRDDAAVARSVGIYPGGELSFAIDSDTRLQLADLLVFNGGSVQIGTESSPVGSDYSAAVIFRDVAFDGNDTTQILRGLVTVGGRVSVHGRALTETFIRTAVEPAAAENQIVLVQSAHDAGWRIGDKVVIPTSAQCAIATTTCEDQTEDRTLTDISGDGLTLTLNDSLEFDHPGAENHDGVIDFTPHIINKSRNVVFRSENPQGIRAHFLFHGRSDIDIRFAEISSLGRTNIENLGADNQKGRYPVHAHHLIGPADEQPNGYQFTLVGNTVDFGTENRQQDRKWGITIHGSHYGLIERNIVDHASGAGIVTESGEEAGNAFRRNFVVRVVGGNGSRTQDRDPIERSKLGRAGAGYWFNGGGRNFFEGNIAAAIAECVYCYGFKFDNIYNGELTFPLAQGADPHMAGGETISADAVGLNNFIDNEAYAVPNGLTVWWECTLGDYPVDNCSSRLESFTVWHHHRWGYFGYPTNNMTLDGFVIRGDASVLGNVYEQVTGLEFSDYMNRNLKIVNADIQNVRTAVNMPAMRDARGATGPLAGINTVEDSYLVATKGVGVWAPATVNDTAGLPPQTTILRNVTFDYPNADLSGQELATIYLHDTSVVLNPDSMDQSLRNDVLIDNYNGVDGEDYYVLPDYQGPDFCDIARGACDSEVEAGVDGVVMGHIYPLQPGAIPE